MGSKFPTLKEVASFKVATLFWNASFIPELSELNEICEDNERNWEIRLTNYRSEAKCNVNAFIKNGYLPRCLKHILRSDILSLHKAYHQLLTWKITYDPGNKIDLFEEGEHYAPSNITLDGEFNDLDWVKHFVLDANCPIIDRFNLACCYWFEEESANLWSEIKILYTNYYGLNYDFFHPEFLRNFGRNSPFILVRLQQLERQSECIFRYLLFPQFIEANERGYEHAVYHIWQKLSFFAKAYILEKDIIFELLSYGIDYPKDKIGFFLYSQLPADRKMELLGWSIVNNRSEIWHILLSALFKKNFAQEMREEIISNFKSLPYQMISNIFNSIALRIKRHKFRSDKMLFDVLWRSLKRDERYLTLYNSSMFIGTLAKAKSFFNLRSIIKKLSKEAKQKCLLNNKYGAGIDIVRILVSGCDFDFLKEYLYFFLTEYSCVHNNWYHCTHNERYPCIIHKCIPCTEKISMHKNAKEVFEEFVNSPDFKRLCENQISEAERKQVKEVIADIDSSLTLLNLQRRM